MAPSVYSRFVRWAQILLPLAALALLATLFLFARAPGDPTEIPYAEVEAIARSERLSKPSFSGVTAGGDTVTASAREVRPEGEGARADGLSVRIETPTGATVDLSAGQGQFDAAAGSARLEGLARVESSTGYQMETGALSADLKTGRVVSDGDLEVRAPYGRVTAGQLVIEPSDDGAQTLVFRNGVHLLYQPQTPVED
ncbi:MAG: hypothetical protein CSA72_13970 [Rhodobacterales bacterium]|nr:MAG: hypothetical protein CSA72_13970 [Rhodobacterales bacterium]